MISGYQEARNYITDFTKQVWSSREYLEDVHNEQLDAMDRQIAYIDAVDVFGQAKKTVEEFESDHLRWRVKSLDDKNYLHLRSKMKSITSMLHDQLMDAKHLVESKRRVQEEAA